jgi:hypothetical protein
MNHLAEGLNLRVKGRKPLPPLAFEVEGELDELDLLRSQEARGSVSAPIKKLRERHHALARMLVTGNMTDGEVAIAVGYDPSRVSVLKSDPAFRELMEFYRHHVDASYFKMHDQLAGLASDALVELRERLEEKPEDVSLGQLIDMVKLGADRTGHGPTTKQEVNVRIGIGERMRQARERARAAMIDVTPREEDADAEVQ